MMQSSIRIGSQTAISSSDRLAPFEFALAHGFDAFEWFADKKVDAQGKTYGWDEADMNACMRAWIRDTGRTHGIRFTVHAPWQANPLQAGGAEQLVRSLHFAHDIGADLVNLHLLMDEGAARYAQSLRLVIDYAARLGLRLSVENTPHTRPQDVNETFACLRKLPLSALPVGMCLDIGHANLCAGTGRDFMRYLDELEPAVPIIHLHVHENYGDSDSHLTLFTGPAGKDDSMIRRLIQRLRRRSFSGAMILEQWPDPPQLLVEAAARLRQMLSSTAPQRGEGADPTACQDLDGAINRTVERGAAL